MKKSFGLIVGLVLLAMFAAAPSHAAVLLSDNFNGENGGVPTLNYYGFANWTVTGGSVDLIGNGFYDFYPGNGLYVDLNGSTGQYGTIQTNLSFAAGTYTLSFDLGGSQRGVDNQVTVSLGNWTVTLPIASGAPLTPAFVYTRQRSGIQRSRSAFSAPARSRSFGSRRYEEAVQDIG